MEEWMKFGSALAVLLIWLYQNWEAIKQAREQRDLDLLHELAPKVVLTVERLARATPTKKDDQALETLKECWEAAGKIFSPQVREYARRLLDAEYQSYKLDALGILPSEDGAEVKAARSAEGNQ